MLRLHADSDHVPCRDNDAMVRELQTPAPGSEPLYFKSRFSTGLLTQVGASDPKVPPPLLFAVKKDTQPHVPHAMAQGHLCYWLES